MFLKCFNPECGAPFDYREGRLVRVSRTESQADACVPRKQIEHFWLCGECAGQFVLVHDQGMCVTMRSRESRPSFKPQPEFVSAA